MPWSNHHKVERDFEVDLIGEHPKKNTMLNNWNLLMR